MTCWGLRSAAPFASITNLPRDRVPIFFAVHGSCPILTTLLQELDELVQARYQLFTQPAELAEGLHRFLTSCRPVAAAPVS